MDGVENKSFLSKIHITGEMSCTHLTTRPENAEEEMKQIFEDQIRPRLEEILGVSIRYKIEIAEI